VLTHGGIVHAVLILTTNAGDVVLDNLSSYIQPWNAVDYVWVERRLAADSSGHWAWVGERPGEDVQQVASR
jgi:predicted transglutaminase-like cysteine proteinase